MRRLLATHEVDTDTPDVSGRTPLSWAAGSGQERVVRFLLDLGADFTAKDASGYAPLMFAIEKENVDVAKLLAEKAGKFNGPNYGIRPEEIRVFRRMRMERDFGLDIVES